MSDPIPVHIAVLGAGSWGTALASHLANQGHTVVLWGRDQALVKSMSDQHENQHYLPGIKLPENLEFTSDLNSVISRSSVVVIATPTHCFSSILDDISQQLRADAFLIWACKGISDNQLLHEIVRQKFIDKYSSAVISGPSFAGELARGMPTAVTVASTTMALATRAGSWFHGNNFRAYASDDIVGVQVAGALKNVFAIAAGISDGLGFGANARAALITRGLAELMRLGDAMGARAETLMGLSGVGDLVLTCTDNQSRNRRFGLALGEGNTVDEALDSIGQVVEGVNTSQQAAQLARLYTVDMPIAEQVFQIVHASKPPHDAVLDLLSRASRTEQE